MLFTVVYILPGLVIGRCVMTAVCGMGSDFPCPICLIPSHELPGLDKTFAIRTAADMKSVYEEAMACELVGDWEAKLKSVSLRFVEVCATGVGVLCETETRVDFTAYRMLFGVSPMTGHMEA